MFILHPPLPLCAAHVLKIISSLLFFRCATQASYCWWHLLGLCFFYFLFYWCLFIVHSHGFHEGIFNRVHHILWLCSPSNIPSLSQTGEPLLSCHLYWFCLYMKYNTHKWEKTCGLEFFYFTRMVSIYSYLLLLLVWGGERERATVCVIREPHAGAGSLLPSW